MASVPAENVAEVTMTFLEDGQYLINKHHFFNGAGWDEGSLNNLGTAVREWWNTNLKPVVASSVSLQEIEVVDLTEGSGLGISVQTGLPLVGANSNQQQPNNVTVAIKKGTGFVGRSFRGRTYHIGLTEAQVSLNTLDPTFATTLRNAYDQLRDPNGPILDGTLCVLSQVENGVPRTAGICTPVTGIGVDPVVDSQRRRLPGRGR